MLKYAVYATQEGQGEVLVNEFDTMTEAISYIDESASSANFRITIQERTLREMVEQTLKDHLDWLNLAVHYDDPKPIPDLQILSDEELWTEFGKYFSGPAIG